MKEIKTKLEDVKRVDNTGEKRHYYLDCRYDGELVYEFEGENISGDRADRRSGFYKGQDHAGYLPDGVGVFWQRKNADACI